MGLDAFVRCNCYKEGKTTPFPFPELEQYYLFQEDGYWGLLPAFEKYSREVYIWQYKACEHKNMRLIREQISNWGGVREFQQALSEIGWQHFPVLKAELPEANGGYMPAESSMKVLQELDYFQREAHSVTKFSLFDTESGHVLYDYIASYRGVFSGKSEIELGIDPIGFFIQMGAEPPVICFRAKRFEQRPLNTSGTDPEAAVVEFYDADTEARFQSPIAVERYVRWPDGRWQNDAGKLNSVMPRLMHVAERTVGAEEYDYIVQPLIRLCKASVETGNPVVWT